MSDCVRSGFCCKQGTCPFGIWDQATHQCAHLIGDTVGEYACGIYDEIIKHPDAVFSPAFGAGCSAALNSDRLLMLSRKHDDLCNYCCEEDHEICFEFKPNSDCVCCADTVRLNSKLIT